MQLVSAVILICSTAIAPADCQPDTALDVLVAPKATGHSLCGLQSQAYLASSALAPQLGDGRYPKLVCTRRHIAATLAWPQRRPSSVAPAGVAPAEVAIDEEDAARDQQTR
jgi:hypothetical protein